MLCNTATSINSNNNIDRNHRITVILALCKLCILHFLTPSRWKMRIKVRCVFEEYQILKKLYVNLTKNSDQNYWNHTHFEFMQIMHICLFIYVFFVEFWAGIRLGTWKKIIVVKIYWWNLCYGCLIKLLSFVWFWMDEIYANYQETLSIEGSKNTTVIFYILDGNILGYPSYIKIDPMLLHVKNFSTYI